MSLWRKYVKAIWIIFRNLIGSLAVLPLAVGLSACPAALEPGSAQHSTTNDFLADVVQVDSRELAAFTELTGTVTGRTSVPLTTKLMSEIRFLEVEEGQRVSKGQILVVLDDSDIAAMRSEAAAYRAEADAALGEVLAVQRQAEAGVAQAEAGLAQAQAALADAQRDRDRMVTLYDQDVVPRAQLDKAELGVEIARENVEQATAAIEQAQASVSQATSRTPQVEAKQQQANARDMQAAALQEYAVLHAPFDGIVSAKYFQQGQLSAPGQPILVVEQADVLRVTLAVPNHIASGLQLGDRFEVQVDSPQGTQLRSGDSVLVRTGWLKAWYDAAPATYFASQPGVGPDAAIWLHEQGMALLGTDTSGTEVVPMPDLERTTHGALIVERGVHVIEIMDLESVADERAYEFLFVCLPLRITGATGSWLRPVAIV